MEDGGIFPLPHNSLPLQVQNAVPAHDRGFLLNDSRVAQFQGPLGQSAWASNGYFLAAQGPCGDLFTIATRKGRPPQKKYLHLRQPPSSRELHTPPLQRLAASQNQEESGFCHRVALNLLGSICVASPRLSRTRQMDHGNSLVIL